MEVNFEKELNLKQADKPGMYVQEFSSSRNS